MYQTEHDELFASIRAGRPLNNGEYMARSTLLAIMGRMATYTGQEITWEQAMNSTEDLSPERYDWQAKPPASPVASPGMLELIQEQSRRENEQAVTTMKTKWGVEVHAVSPQLDQEWRTFAEGVYPRIRGGMVPADIFDRTKQLVDEYRASHK